MTETPCQKSQWWCLATKVVFCTWWLETWSVRREKTHHSHLDETVSGTSSALSRGSYFNDFSGISWRGHWAKYAHETQLGICNSDLRGTGGCIPSCSSIYKGLIIGRKWGFPEWIEDSFNGFPLILPQLPRIALIVCVCACVSSGTWAEHGNQRESLQEAFLPMSHWIKHTWPRYTRL